MHFPATCTSMEKRRKLEVALSSASAALVVLLLLALYLCRRRRLSAVARRGGQESGCAGDFEPAGKEELLSFEGGEGLTVHDILDAPGEVVGKSSSGTLYKASLLGLDSVVLLRFLRPASSGPAAELLPEVRLLGLVRHPNLVPLQAFFAGTRGEKLLVHPFFVHGNLADFMRDGTVETHLWPLIYKISHGIAKGLEHLHTGLPTPIIHGNLKSKNVLLDSDFQSFVSDFGLHLVLRPTAAQEMLEACADEGYKAPELIKMKEVRTECDVYSLGIIFLEMLTGKVPLHHDPSLAKNLCLPTTLRNAVLEKKVMDIMNPKLLRQIRGQKQQQQQNVVKEEALLMYFQLAMSCCSPSPSLRPDMKQVVRKLEEIGQF